MRTYPLSKHRKSVSELSHHSTLLTWKEKTYPDQWAARMGRGRWSEALARKNAHTHLHENLKGNGDAVMSGVVAQAFNLGSWEQRQVDLCESKASLIYMQFPCQPGLHSKTHTPLQTNKQTCLCIFVCVYAYACRSQRSTFEVFLNHSLAKSRTDAAGPACWQAPETLLSLSPQCWDNRYMLGCWGFEHRSSHCTASILLAEPSPQPYQPCH